MQSDAILDYGAVFDGCDPAVRQDVVRPLLLGFGRVAVLDALQVEGFVDVFEEVDAHDTVVGALVFSEGLRPESGVAVVCYFRA